jgi:hypothetical protein
MSILHDGALLFLMVLVSACSSEDPVGSSNQGAGNQGASGNGTGAAGNTSQGTTCPGISGQKASCAAPNTTDSPDCQQCTQEKVVQCNQTICKSHWDSLQQCAQQNGCVAASGQFDETCVKANCDGQFQGYYTGWLRCAAGCPHLLSCYSDNETCNTCGVSSFAEKVIVYGVCDQNTSVCIQTYTRFHTNGTFEETQVKYTSKVLVDKPWEHADETNIKSYHGTWKTDCSTITLSTCQGKRNIKWHWYGFDEKILKVTTKYQNPDGSWPVLNPTDQDYEYNISNLSASEFPVSPAGYDLGCTN